jgi:protein TonB
MSPLMQVKIALLAGLFGLLMVSAIPSYAQTVNAQTNTVEAWKKKIVIQLASKREFPPGAMGQGGTAKVKFAIDRQGKLIARELVESTGSELLDSAVLRMVERAEPFPEPPAEVSDDGLAFTVPVIFVARKQVPWAGGQWPEDWVEEQGKVNAKIRGICRGC